MPLITRKEPTKSNFVKKKKILFLSDHPLAPSGVGVQARMLIDGLVKTGKYSFLCLGGAIKHPSYETVFVSEDFIVKPVDGFGTREQIRNILLTERPDALLIFTDPRQFIWLWEIEDEIHQICPIAYWHVWDNDPYPTFNKAWYESTDLINCLSQKTYELVKPNFPHKTNYIPHSFPKEMFFAGPPDQVAMARRQHFGDRADWFTALWVNRNATRKMPADLLDAWKLFVDRLEREEGHRKACLIMHTDPMDNEGPNLFAVMEQMGLKNNVMFSTQKLEFQQMNVMHNIVDVCVNIAKAEGFGLSTLISMQVGVPILALKTGGLTRQVVDYRDGSEHGVAIEPITRKLVGSQLVPFIYEDYAAQEEVADGFMKLYKMNASEKAKLKSKMIDYVDHEFSYGKMIQKWDETLTELFQRTKEQKWSISPLQAEHEIKPSPPKDLFKKIQPSVMYQIMNQGKVQ
jgi:glycosyltransferase involved in cell wall biosynthesis